MKRYLSNLNRVASVVLALVVVLLINLIALFNPVRIDLSGRKFFSLSKKTINLLKGLEQRVDVFVIFQEEHALYFDIENLLKEYKFHSRNIDVKLVDPVRDRGWAEKLAGQYGLIEAKVVVFDMNGKSAVVTQAELANAKMEKGRRKPVFSDFKGEQAFSSAIQGLVQGETPVVYFLVGHGEKRVAEFDQVTGYSRIGTALFRDNLDLRELALTSEKRIPDDAAALVVISPDKTLSKAEVEMVEDYLRRSGRVMVLLDALTETGLEPMLRRWGVGLRNDFVLDPRNTLKGSDVYVGFNNEHPITKPLGDTGARFYLPRSVEPLDGNETGCLVVPLAVTSENSWSEAQVNDTPKYDKDTEDVRGPVSLAVAVERGTSQEGLDVEIQPSRMVVFGDSDFVSNGALTGGDQDLFMSAMNWLLDREELMAIAPKSIKEEKFGLDQNDLNTQAWINVVGIPLLAVVGGLLMWIRRRK